MASVLERVLISIDERHYQWVYPDTATVALVLAVLVPTHRHVATAARRHYVVLQALTLLGAIIGAKLAFLAGDLGWPLHHVGWSEVLFSGRSITGGLLGGFLTAELGKRVLAYRELPNDHFAAKLPLSIAIGRVGCVLAGCCAGVPVAPGPLAVVYSDGVARFPAQLVELAFQLVAFGVLVGVVRRGALRGRVFATYMMAYGAFRVVIEAWRVTPKSIAGASGYQWLSLVLVMAGAYSFAWYSRAARRAPAIHTE